jgi:hypothetical protein
MLVNDLVSVTLRNLEGRDYGAMGSVEKGFNLFGVSALDHVESN